MLVVADPPHSAELVGAFEEPLPIGAVDVVVTGGGDDTIDEFDARGPRVVIITATLEEGDAKSLIEALRDMVSRDRMVIVLVGDDNGPIKTALDAIDMKPDRFVSRPLSAKALRFAVQSGLETVARAIGDRADSSPALSRVPTPVRGSGSGPIKGIESAAKHAPTVGRSPTDRGIGIASLPPAANDSTMDSPKTGFRARLEAIADSISADEIDEDLIEEDFIEADLIDEDDTGAPPLPPIEIAPKRTNTNPEFIPAPPIAPWRPGSTELREETGVGDIVDPPAREPTLILMDEVSSQPLPSLGRPPAMPGESEPELRERWSKPVLLSQLIDRSRDSSKELLASVRDAGDLGSIDDIDDDIIVRHPATTPPPHAIRGGKLQALEDLIEPEPPDGMARQHPEAPAHDATETRTEPKTEPRADQHVTQRAELRADRAPRSEQRPEDAAPPERPSGRDFARQLRAKMSQMAQRLFQSDVAAPPPVDIRPRHDHHTEIDLASLGEEPMLGGGVTEIEARGRASIGDPPQMPTSPGTWDTSVRERGLPEAGEIVRGVSDTASIIARMFAQSFTGRVGFRKEDVEKVIYFDQGRPVFASSNEPGDRMGELLVREGKITASQYERCQTHVAQSGRRMGEILVDFGYLKRRELLPAVRRHVEDILYSLFGWDHGSYRIMQELAASAERIRLSRHPASLVLEGIRRKLDRTTLEKLIGPSSTVIEVPDRERLASVINIGDLSTEERASLGAFDGQADLAQVARTTGYDVADVIPFAWGLCVLGLATARRSEQDVNEESTALVGETDMVIDRERVRARWQLVTEADYFALLGVRRDATAFEIRRAYQAARRDFAADCFPQDLRRELALELDEIANVLDEAFRVLRDDRLRLTYLSNLIE